VNKKLAALGLAAGLTAGGAAGLIVAAPSISGAQSTTTAPDGSTSTDPGRPDPGARVTDVLSSLVSDGTLTQDQADKVAQALKDALPEGRGPGMGRGMGLDAAATALGMSTDDLHTALEGGQTLAQVAASKGIDVQTVIDALVADATTHIDDEVAAGHLTQEQADTRLSDLTDRITDMVNNGPPARDGRGPGGPPTADGSSTQTG